MTKIITDIDIAVKEIVEGRIISLPTETVYGLGADALNENASLRIFEAKLRPVFNPMIVHIFSKDDFKKYAMDIPDVAYELAEKFSPGPISFVLKKKSIIPDIVTSGNDSVALRIPSHKMFREVIKNSGVPVCAPSANMSGRISPTTAEEVFKELQGKVNFILDGGKSSIGIESTVISFLEEKIEILRSGYITKEEIEKVTGRISNKKKSDKIISPGQMKSHYAPKTPLYILDGDEKLTDIADVNIGILNFDNYGNLKEIALNLFSDLRKLDEMNFNFILCKGVTDEGLGEAINDRLKRASSGKCSIVNGKISIDTK